MIYKVMIISVVLFSIIGCYADKKENETMKKTVVSNDKKNKKSDIEKVIINGSPNPPKGYERPVVKDKK